MIYVKRVDDLRNVMQCDQRKASIFYVVPLYTSIVHFGKNKQTSTMVEINDEYYINLPQNIDEKYYRKWPMST